MAETRVVVTGGAGFIGSHFVRHLLARHKDYKVVVVDKMTYAGNPDNIRDFQTDPRVRLLFGNIASEWTTKRFETLGPVTHIVNFAAESFVDSSIHGRQDAFIHSNVHGVLNLLTWVRENPHVRYLQVGTDEVYGDLQLHSPLKFRESDPLKPNNPDSASKASADHFVRAFVHTYGINACTTRCSNNYGPYQFPEKFIPRMIRQALHDEPLPIYAKGENIRDWIHVSDHCTALDKVMHEGQTGQVYNVGGECERANIEVAKSILDLLGKPHSLLSYVDDRPGHDMKYAVDCTLIQSCFNWSPMVNFHTGLKETVQWYVDNREWIDRIESGDNRKYWRSHTSEGAQHEVTP